MTITVTMNINGHNGVYKLKYEHSNMTYDIGKTERKFTNLGR